MLVKCKFLVSGVGQLNVPSNGTLPSTEVFKGKVMHSARWDTNYDYAGKRIAIIGTGATAAQIIPEIVKTAAKVDVFQRTANWVVPRNDQDISPFRKQLYSYVPMARSIYRGKTHEYERRLF